MKRARVQDRSGRNHSGRDRPGQHRDGERLHRHWGSRSAGNNRDHSRSDAFSNLDDPFKRYVDNREPRRAQADVVVRQWSQRAELVLPQPCRLCPNTAFLKREDWLAHVDAIDMLPADPLNRIFTYFRIACFKIS